MKKSKSLALIVFLSLFAYAPAMASHLAGEDLTYALVDSSAGVYHYRVTLSIYDDCLNGDPLAILNDNPAYLAVYTGADSLVEADSNVYYTLRDSIPIMVNGSCSGGTLPAVCSERFTFVKDYYLPASATGYNIVYERCCLNFTANLYNAFNQGMALTCHIPPSSITTHNNSAVFTNYPPLILIPGIPLAYNCAATDADGDSLTYEFCTGYTYTAADSPQNLKPFPTLPPPYIAYTYIAPLSYSNPMTCSVPLTINAVTGLLTGTPDSDGVYFVSVCCSEWRDGVLINTVQREFEFTV